MKLKFNLTVEQAKFAVWFETEMPYLLQLFDFHEAAYINDMVDRYLATASHSQTIMARFALGVWRHDNHYNFDFVMATRILDEKDIQIITKWMTSPFWP